MGLLAWYATVWGLLLLLLGIVPYYQVYRLLMSECHGYQDALCDKPFNLFSRSNSNLVPVQCPLAESVTQLSRGGEHSHCTTCLLQH
jgi:hypothetical protein